MRNLEAKFYTCMILALICICPASGQEILQKKKTEIQGKGPTGTYTRLIKLFGKNYFTTGRGGHYRVYYGGELYSGEISDTLIKEKRQDQFLFELDSNLEVKDYYVIDNCEEYIDHTNTDKYGVMAVHFEDTEDADSLAVMTLPEGIQLKRSDYLDRSVLIVTDSNFNYIEHLVPTTGKILLIEGGRENLYMTIRIPFGRPYILVGQDTFYNQPAPPFQLPSSLIIASYNLTSKTFNWSKWIGGTYLDYIHDFKLDSEENLVLLISPLRAIELVGEDTIDIGRGPDYNIILKFNKYGEYLWSENFEESYSEYFYSLHIDDLGSIYLLGLISYDEILLDTFLSVGNVSQIPSHTILLKLKTTGEFDWIYHMEGDYLVSAFYNLAFNNASNSVFVSGFIDHGNFKFNNIDYVTSSDYSSVFILKMDKDNGSLKGHILSQDGKPVKFSELMEDNTANLIVYIVLSDRINYLGEELSPFTFSAGYLLRVSSMWDSIVSTRILSASMFKMYPNPISFDQYIQLELDQSYLSKNTHAVIVDMQGFVVKAVLVQDQVTSISSSGLIPGMYSLCVYNNQYYKSEMISIIK